MLKEIAKEIEKTDVVHLSKKLITSRKIGGIAGSIIIDVVASKDKEGMIKAVFTGIASYLVTDFTIDISAILGGSMLTASVSELILALAGIAAAGLIISKIIDAVYDCTEPYIEKAIYDARTKALELVTKAKNIDEIKDFIRMMKGIRSVETVYITSITEDRSYTYKVVYGDTIWQVCKDNDITYEQLIEVNPWLRERFSDDFSFALIMPDETIIIPEKVKFKVDEELREEWEELQTKLKSQQQHRKEVEKIVKALMDEIIKAANNRCNGDGYFNEGKVS